MSVSTLLSWPKMMIGTILALAFCSLAVAETTPSSLLLPLHLLFPSTKNAWPPNTVAAPMPRDTKRQMAQMFMMFNPLSVRDLINVMAYKQRVRNGLSIDEVVDSLVLRAQKHGFMLVKRFQMWRKFPVIEGEEAPYKVEVISICDPPVSREWMDYAPEMALHVPPRIAVVEDRNRELWLMMMMDWEMQWIEPARNARLDPKLLAQGIQCRGWLEDIVRAAANGEK